MARANLTIQQGDDYSLTFPVFDDKGFPAVLTTDGTLTGTPFTAAAQIRRDIADVDVTADATFSMTVQPVGSRITIALAAATTVTLSPTQAYVWDCQIVNPSTSAKTTIAAGRVSVVGEVTRP